MKLSRSWRGRAAATIVAAPSGSENPVTQPIILQISIFSPMNYPVPVARHKHGSIVNGPGQTVQQNRIFAIAPMMDWTDRHCRVFHRLLSSRALLYTEMITAKAILHGDRQKLLGYSAQEHPVALQLGGSDVDELAQAARIGADWGYDEINLNVGCPSPRVQNGQFGAALMATPELVRDCVSAMRQAVDIPVTVKCRIGIDDQDEQTALDDFVGAVAEGGCRRFIVHARKAWLEGLSPKENREVPPLNWNRVYRLKQDFPDLEIVLNGGVLSVEASESHLDHVDGVMLGRAAYQNPYLLTAVDSVFFDSPGPPASRDDILKRFIAYAEIRCAKGVRLHQMTRHILGLYQGEPGARAFRRHLSIKAVKPGAGVEVLHGALALMEETRGAHAALVA